MYEAWDMSWCSQEVIWPSGPARTLTDRGHFPRLQVHNLSSPQRLHFIILTVQTASTGASSALSTRTF